MDFAKKIVYNLSCNKELAHLKGGEKMAKSFFEAMKRETLNSLDVCPMELIGIEEGQSTNSETGEISRFVRVDVEIPKGNGAFSRCQIRVKIPNGKMKIQPEEIETGDYTVVFENLTISYIDGKSNVYFRAENYSVQKDD